MVVKYILGLKSTKASFNYKEYVIKWHISHMCVKNNMC